MKRNLLPLMFLIAFALLAIAIAVDCVRIAGDYRERVALADADVAKPEVRLAKLLESSPQVTPEVTAAIASYRDAQDWPARHDAFEALAASFQKTMASKLNATNPLDRKFMDDVAGATNRRQVAEKPFDEEEAAYRSYLASWRGQIAQWFSATARADAKSISS
jgi:hypothetical protein